MELLLAAVITLAQITQVLDGDTVKTGSGEKIRFSGLDCPEKAQKYGPEAKDFTTQEICGKVVIIDSEKKDLYGRDLAWIKIGERNINEEIVSSGFAWSYFVKKDSIMRLLEKEARDKHLGLWHDKNPMPPWEFRKQKKIKVK